MPIELGVGYVTIVPSARGFTAAAEKEMAGPLVLAGRSSGAKSSAAFSGAFKSGLKTAAVGVGLIAGLAAVGESFEGAFNTIARGTGATGKELEGLDNSFKTVLKNGSGSFDQVSQAITVLNQRTGLTGKALEDFAAKEVTLARITKTDVGANLQATTGLFNLYGVAASQQSDKLDLLFRASQVAGVSITDLAGDMQAAAPTAKILGLNIDQTAAVVANLDKAGLPASKVMLGLAGAFAKAAKQGRDPLDVIHDLSDELKNAPTATAAATIAVKKFGIGARQAATLVAGLRSGAIDLNATLDSGKGILATAAATQTLSGKFAHLRNVALVALEPLAKQTLSAIARGVELIIPLVETLTNHMNILGPVLLTAGAAFVAFKVALGVEKIVAATTLAFTQLKTTLLLTAEAETATKVSTEATTAALGGQAVAAEGAATATKGLALSTAGLASVVVVGAIATAALGKTLFDLFAISSKAKLNVKGAADEFATSLIGTSKNAIEAKASLDTLTTATKKWFQSQGAADEQTGGAIIRNLGISYGTVTKAVLDSSDGIDTFVKSLHLSDVNAETLSGGLHKLRDSLEETARATISHLEGTKAITKAQSDAAISATRASDGSKDYVAALRLLGVQSTTVTAAQGATRIQLELQRQSWTNLTTAIIANTDALRGSQEGFLGILGAAVNAQQGVFQVADAQKAYNDAVKQFGPNSSQAIQAGLALKSVQISTALSTKTAVDAAEKWAAGTSGLTAALKTQADALKKSGPDSAAYAKATDDVTVKQGAFRKALEAAAAMTKGPVHDALVKYLDDTANLHHEIDKVPTTKTTAYTAPGLDAAFTRTHNYRGELDHLPPLKATSITLNADQAILTIKEFRSLVNSIPNNVSFKQAIAFEGGRGVSGRAKGGPVRAGRDYLVGERGGPRGTELLRMFAAGGGYVFSNTHPITKAALPELAQGAVFRKRTLAVVGEDARTTPEIVSPVKLMAETFRSVLKATRSTTVVVKVVKDNTSQFNALGEQIDRTVAAGIDKFAPLVAAATARLGQTIVSNLSASGGTGATSLGATSTTPLATAGATNLGGSGGTGGGGFGEFIERLKHVVPQHSGESINEWKARLRQFLAQRPGESVSEWKGRIRQQLGVNTGEGRAAGGTSGGTADRGAGGFAEFIERALQVIPQHSGESINEWKRRIQQGLAQRSGESIGEWKKRIQELFGNVGAARTTLPGIASSVRPATSAKTAGLSVPAARTDSGQFDVHLVAPTVSPAAQLTPTFKTDLQRTDGRSLTVTNNQENHFEGRPAVEELAVLNRKLGMRVAIAGRR